MSRCFELPVVSRLNDLIFLNISDFSTAYYMYGPSHLPYHYSDNILWPAHYEIPHHAIFFILLSIPPPYDQTLFSEHCHCALPRYSNTQHFTGTLIILFPIWIFFLRFPAQGEEIKYFEPNCIKHFPNFYIRGSVHHNSSLKKSNEMQQYAGIYLPLNYCTCFGRPSRPSSGVHKTVAAATGTDHTICGASFLKRLRKLALHIVWSVPVAAATVLCTPDDGCDGRPKHVQ